MAQGRRGPLNKHLNRTFRKFRSAPLLLGTMLVRAQQEMDGIGHTDGGESSGGSYADLGSGGAVIVPVKDPENYTYEELVAMYLELGFSQEDSEIFSYILKNAVPEGFEIN